ncbi:MAG: ATP-binding protein [Bacteroidales bacterium]
MTKFLRQDGKLKNDSNFNLPGYAISITLGFVRSGVVFIPAIFRGILLIRLFFPASFLFSQHTYVPDYGDPLKESWRWTIFNELSAKGVRSIAESSDGNIWFGLNNGIIRYNGHVWKEYNRNNGFISSTVYHLISSNNQIYAGTDTGLYVFKNEHWKKIFPLGVHPKNNRLQKINCLRKLQDGSVIASVGGGLYKGLVTFYHNKTTFLASQKAVKRLGSISGIELQVVPDDKCLNSSFCVEEVFQDTQHRTWIWASEGKDEGKIFYYTLSGDKSQNIHYSKNFTPADGLVKGENVKFVEDRKGNIWTVNSDINITVNIFNGSKWTCHRLKGGNTHYSVFNVNGNIWIGGYAVLYIHENGIWKKYQRPTTAIPESNITLYKDNNGYLWIIGIQNDVIRVDYFNKKWASFNSLNFQCEDMSDNLWFLSVDGKVVVKKENNWFYYSTNDGLPDAPVKIFCSKNGLICCAGSYNKEASVSYFNGRDWARHVFPMLSWGIDYRAVFEDNDGNLWIGASANIDRGKGQEGGVLKIENPGTSIQKISHYKPDDKILRQAYGFAQTKDGTIWIAGSCTNYFSNGKWNEFTDIKKLNQYSNCIGNTPDGVLWIGSRMSGIFCYDNKTWKNFDVENGLKSNTIISILPISKNNIWIATNRDFCRFDGKNWTTEILPEYLILSREGGDIQIQKDGTLWINRSSRDWKRRALNNNTVEKEDIEYFSTFSYKEDTLKPDTKILSYSKEVPSSGNTLIEWTGIDTWNTTPALKLQYSYRLNGGNWAEYSYKSNVTFLKLKDGKYKFEVKARDMDFNTDPSPAFIEFRVRPPVWKQAWFIILILLFLIIIIAYQYSVIKQKKYLQRFNVQLENHSDEIERKNVLLKEQQDQILHQIILEKERHQSKIRFFTNISHEFRTPLTLIAGVIENFTGNTFKTNPAVFQNHLTAIKRNTNRLLSLINQLMDFRKMENDSIALKVSESDIVRFMNDICYSFKEFAKRHHIKLKFHSHFESLEGWFDPDKLEKISYNLISNAIKFTNEGGSIFIKLNTVNNNEYVELIIEDTGIGIVENEIKKIFEPFYQVADNVSVKYDGTGIGLYLVNSLVDLHHGKMQVESTTDKKLQAKQGFSTRFTITLPFNKSRYEEKEIGQSGQPIYAYKDSIYDDSNPELNDVIGPIEDIELPNKRTVPLILVIEDNEDLRRFMVNSLDQYYKVINSGNGDKAFDLIIKHIPDLIISDIMMPGMSGTDLCYKIKNDIRISHIPVLLLTARITDENKMEGFQIGADDYITKPFNMSLLVARIKNILAIRLSLRRKFNNEKFSQPDEVHISSMDKQFLQKVKTIVEKNYTNHLFSVELLSDEVGISRRHLLYKLQNLIDMTPTDYIKVFRLNMAARLLAAKKASISEIVDEVGFSDISYFSKCFAHHFGMTPTAYIKTYYKGEDIQ